MPLLTMNQYQELTAETAIYPYIGGLKYLYPALGLPGEVGEVVEQIKKAVRDDGGVITPARLEKIRKELGDVLWYTARLAAEVGLTLDNVARENYMKLKKRQDEGKLQGEGSER